jgi:hypothetical protein
MSASPAIQYFVRVRGRVQGPYELSRLKILRARGQFSRVFEISEDGQTWISSESLSELIDPAPAARPPDVDPVDDSGLAAPAGARLDSSPPDRWDDWGPRRRRRSESNLGTMLLIAMLVIVPAGIVGAILLMQRLERDRSTASENEPVPEEQAGQATFEYWTKFKAARDRLVWGEGSGSDVIIARLRSVASEMADLPTLGVDTEASELVIDYSSALNQVASAMSAANDPSTFLEALARGAAGDPFGKAVELKSSSDAALRQFAEVEQRSTRVRATLTSTYARQFP